MPTSLEAARLLMLGLVLAAIPFAMAIELFWDRMPLHRNRGHLHLTIPWRAGLGHLRHPLLDPLPFGLAVAILTAYLVVALISNSL